MPRKPRQKTGQGLPAPVLKLVRQAVQQATRVDPKGARAVEVAAARASELAVETLADQDRGAREMLLKAARCRPLDLGDTLEPGLVWAGASASCSGATCTFGCSVGCLAGCAVGGGTTVAFGALGGTAGGSGTAIYRSGSFTT